MFAGIEKNAQAMDILTQRQDVISNNLANVGTTGFKKDSVSVHNFSDVLQSAVYPDPAMGLHHPTGNPLDLAIDGQGYLSIQTPTGVQLTRDGALRLTPQGQLVTQDGLPVLSESGTITLSPDSSDPLTIERNGQIHQGSTALGKLLVVQLAPGSTLLKAGNSRYALQQGGTIPANAGVVQGALEQSTSQSVTEMVDMIDTLRQFEANQKSIRMQDDVLGRAINTLGGL